jgi:hypothetical protein
MLGTKFPNQRIVVGASDATLAFQPVDQDGEPVAGTGYTVTVTDSEGTDLVTDAATVDGTPVTYVLSGTLFPRIDELTATWSEGGTVRGVTTVAAVGGVHLTLAEVAQFEPTLNHNNQDVRHSRETVLKARAEAETMVEEWCKRAFVPRFSVERVSGQGKFLLDLSWANFRAARWANELDYNTSHAIPATVLSTAGPRRGPTAILDGEVWRYGKNNIEIGYEHGLDSPPEDLKRVTAAIMRRQLEAAGNPLDARAIQYYPAEGGSVMLAQPGQRGSMTGMPEIDEVLKRYKWRPMGVR